jgi:hypothetical protein
MEALRIPEADEVKEIPLIDVTDPFFDLGF